MIILDKNGREIREGDILKVYHFRTRQRKIYMYKLVVRCDKERKITSGGEYLYCVDVVDIGRQLSLGDAFKCPLSVVDFDEVEVIDGQDYWWERKKHVKV